MAKKKQARRAEPRWAIVAGHGTVGFLLILAAAWGARILFLLRQQDHHSPLSLLFRGDTPAYLHFAGAMLRGVPHDSGIPFHPPGYAFFLSLLLSATGGDPSAAALTLRIIMALTGALTCALLYRLLTRVCGRAVALAALPLTLFSFGHYVLATALNAESFFMLLAVTVTLGLVSILRSLQNDSRRAARQRCILAGVLGLVAGWAGLTRAEFLLTAILLAAVLILRGRRRALLPASIFLLLFAFTLVPWTVRCYRSIGAVNQANADRLPRPLPQLVLVTGYGPLNFATANNQFATGAFDTRLVDRLVSGREGRSLDLADPQINRLYRDGYRIGFTWLRQHPPAALELIGRKLWLAAHSLSLGYLQGNLPAGLIGERRPVDLFAPHAHWLLWAHLTLCLAGLWRLWRGRGTADEAAVSPDAVILVPLVLTPLLVIVAFFGYVRIGVLLAPVVWALEGAGVLALLERLPWPASWRRRPERVVALIVAGLLLIEAVGTATGPLALRADGPRLPGGTRLNPDELIQIRPRR